MNIKQALKKKNKLVEKIKQEFGRLYSYNSYEVGVNRPYSPTVSLNNYIKLTEELINLKTDIHKANYEVYDKIFRMSELKSMVKLLKGLNCNAGKDARGYGNIEPRVMDVQITTVDRDKMVEQFEMEIEQLQDELDYYNQVTEI